MCSAPRVYEKMYAAVIARVQTASPAKRAVFRWAVRIGTRFSQAQNPGPVLKARRRLADRLVLTGLRKQLTGGRRHFIILRVAVPQPKYVGAAAARRAAA